jgi:hypothetical protein
MLAIVMEGVLFVALAVACGALLYFVVMSTTPLGKRWREVRNRRRIEEAAAIHCPVHGQLVDQEMVRLPSGDRVCPHCFKETA